METAFTPVASLLGGALIGFAAVLLMATLGRILGATGILGGLLPPKSGRAFVEGAALVAGMASAPLVLLAITGTPVAVEVPVGMPMLVIGGLLVGFGAATGSGCTSGHGVCGLARLSPRSLVATLTFMAATFATVFVLRHVLGV